jgi:hypothetical protein
VAQAITDGTAELQPHWRNDTPEAKALDERLRRENRPGAIGCAVLIAFLVAIVFFLVVIAWNTSGSSDPSYWH